MIEVNKNEDCKKAIVNDIIIAMTIYQKHNHEFENIFSPIVIIF